MTPQSKTTKAPDPSPRGFDGAGSLRPPGEPADLRFGVFTVRDGQVHRGRETYSIDMAFALLAELRRDAKSDAPWWPPIAGPMADHLEAAMRAAGIIQEFAA
jgi:hypothetical protein